MYAEHPAIAKRWSAGYPEEGKLPARVGSLMKRKKKAGMKPVSEMMR